MVDEALQYVHQVAVKGGWDVNDVDVIFQLETSDCAKTLVTSREVSGFCIAVGQESSVIALLETP
jgi:prolyl-tRNA editing enzyme YbaK/EbsC (Cys-tRNA(Pro) deacylase)